MASSVSRKHRAHPSRTRLHTDPERDQDLSRTTRRRRLRGAGLDQNPAYDFRGRGHRALGAYPCKWALGRVVASVPENTWRVVGQRLNTADSTNKSAKTHDRSFQRGCYLQQARGLGQRHPEPTLDGDDHRISRQKSLAYMHLNHKLLCIGCTSLCMLPTRCAPLELGDNAQQPDGRLGGCANGLAQFRRVPTFNHYSAQFEPTGQFQRCSTRPYSHIGYYACQQ